MTIKPVKKFQITNCQECPFCNYDNEFGYDGCNLPLPIESLYSMPSFAQLPSDTILEDCPLKEFTFEVSTITFN